MADIVFRYEQMRSVVNNLRDLALQYQNAAQRFESDFSSAVSNWEGDSKAALLSFIQGSVNEYISNSVPRVVNGQADLLEANVNTMEEADRQISENIPQSLG